ncbi:hypothetical protein LNO89_30670 [Klebsiella pneumoniae subsp. pneumoniae]|nr:hypothetical protein [Klebsiella pneumoniae subsp. pneumoniae]
MIADITSNTDKSFSKRDVDLELNTMPDTGLIDSRHWLDSGSVKKIMNSDQKSLTQGWAAIAQGCQDALGWVDAVRSEFTSPRQRGG